MKVIKDYYNTDIYLLVMMTKTLKYFKIITLLTIILFIFINSNTVIANEDCNAPEYNYSEMGFTNPTCVQKWNYALYMDIILQDSNFYSSLLDLKMNNTLTILEYKKYVDIFMSAISGLKVSTGPIVDQLVWLGTNYPRYSLNETAMQKVVGEIYFFLRTLSMTSAGHYSEGVKYVVEKTFSIVNDILGSISVIQQIALEDEYKNFLIYQELISKYFKDYASDIQLMKKAYGLYDYSLTIDLVEAVRKRNTGITENYNPKLIAKNFDNAIDKVNLYRRNFWQLTSEKSIIINNSLFVPDAKLAYPIIFVHGLSGSDKTFQKTMEYMTKQYNLDNIHVYDILLNADNNVFLSNIINDIKSEDFTFYFQQRSFSYEDKIDVLLGKRTFHEDYRKVKDGWNYDEGAQIFAINFQEERIRGIGANNNYYYQSNESAIFKQGKALGIMINEVLDFTKAKKVILVGHSMGGLAIREYLQRTDEKNNHRWWIDPHKEDGHMVAKVVTIGTPHLGSNAGLDPTRSRKQKSTIPDPLGKSEALRDLKYSFDSFTGCTTKAPVGIYLFGGNESCIAGFNNSDINCNGSESDDITGISYGTKDNPKMPLPRNIKYTWIISDVKYGENPICLTSKTCLIKPLCIPELCQSLNTPGDGSVLLDKQWLHEDKITPVPKDISDVISTEIEHNHEGSDYISIIKGLDEPESITLAYEIALNETVIGLVNIQPNNEKIDSDTFKIINPEKLYYSQFMLSINCGREHICRVDFIDSSDNIFNTYMIQNIPYKLAVNIPPTMRDFFVKISSIPDNISIEYPYFIKVNHAILEMDTITVSGTFNDLTVKRGFSTKFNGLVKSTAGKLTKVTAAVSLPDGSKDLSRLSVKPNSSDLDLSIFQFDTKYFNKLGVYRIGIWAKSNSLPDPQNPLVIFTVTVIDDNEPPIITSFKLSQPSYYQGDHLKVNWKSNDISGIWYEQMKLYKQNKYIQTIYDSRMYSSEGTLKTDDAVEWKLPLSLIPADDYYLIIEVADQSLQKNIGYQQSNYFEIKEKKVNQLQVQIQVDNVDIKDSEVVNASASGTYSSIQVYEWSASGGKFIQLSDKNKTPNIVKWQPPKVQNSQIYKLTCLLSDDSDKTAIDSKSIFVKPDKDTPLTDKIRPTVSNVYVSKTKVLVNETITISWKAFDNMTNSDQLVYTIQYLSSTNNWNNVTTNISNIDSISWAPQNVSENMIVCVNATDEAGNVSLWKESESFQVRNSWIEPPGMPNLYPLDKIATRKEVTLIWQKVLDENNNHSANSYIIQCSKQRNNIEDGYKIEVTPNVPGVNRYETLEHTVNACNGISFIDDTTYFFRVSGKNEGGIGQPSVVYSTTIKIQDQPEFDTSYQVPQDGATNISKNPRLSWRASDKDGDEIDYYVEIGTNENGLYTIRAFESDQKGETYYDFATESNKKLLPGTTYFWRVKVREHGKTQADYGGTYPLSPTWSFTTESTGSDLAIIKVESPEVLQPASVNEFKITVKNIGTEIASFQHIKSYYIKNNNQESPFLNGSASMVTKHFNPGDEEVVNSNVVFRDSIFEKDGILYDNILAAGESYVRFFFADNDEQDVNKLNNEYIATLFYEDSDGPEITGFNIYSKTQNSLNTDFWAIAGYELRIDLGGKDNHRVTQGIYEFRLHSNDEWKLLHSQNNSSQIYSYCYEYLIPKDTIPTDDAQVRVTLSDDSNHTTSRTVQVPIYSDRIDASIKTDKMTYIIGDTINYNISVDSDNKIQNVTVLLEGSHGGIIKEINIKNGLDEPIQFSWVIPNNNAYASNDCFLKLKLRDIRANEIEINSNKFNIRANTELPAPFIKGVTIYNNKVSLPLNALRSTQESGIIFIKLDENNKVHCVIEHYYIYFQPIQQNSKELKLIYENNKYYITYDPSSKRISSKINICDKNYNILDFIIFNNTPYVLLSNEYNQYFYSFKNDTSFITPKCFENHNIPKMTISKVSNNHQVFFNNQGRYPFIDNYFWNLFSHETSIIERYPFANGIIGEREIVRIENNVAQPTSTNVIESSIDKKRIYAIDSSNSQLIELDTEHNIRNSYKFPVIISEEWSESIRRSLIAMNNNVYIFEKGKVYKLNGSQIVEYCDIKYTISGETINYAEKDNWKKVNTLNAIKADNKIFLILTDNEPSNILEFIPSDSLFTKSIGSVQKKLNRISLYDGISFYYKTHFFTKYIGYNKLLVTFSDKEDERVSAYHDYYYSFLQLFDIETGEVNYLGKLPFKLDECDTISLFNSNDNIFAIVNDEAYQINISSTLIRKKQVKDPQFHTYNNNLYITWSYGNPYDGRWNIDTEKINDDILKKNNAKVIAPSEGNNYILVNEFQNGKCNIADKYISFPKTGTIYQLNQNLEINKKIIDGKENRNYFSFQSYNPNFIGVSEDKNDNLILFKSDLTSETINISDQEPLAFASFNNESIFISKKSNQLLISKFDNATKEKRNIVLNDSGTFTINTQTESIDINKNKYVAVAWDNYLAVGDLSGDIIQPDISFLNSSHPITKGDTITINWQASDNRDELTKYELYKKTSSNYNLIKTINDISIKSYTYHANDSDTVSFKIIAYDYSGNTSYDTITFDIRNPVYIETFNINKTTVQFGDKLIFTWTETGATNETEYSVCFKREDTTDWNTYFTITGESSKVASVKLLPGKYKFVLKTRDDSKLLDSYITITGVEFISENFSPQNTLIYNNNLITFSWNVKEERLPDNILYSLYIKKDNNDEYEIANQTTDTNSQYLLSESINSIDWKVTAQYQGIDYSSENFHVQLIKVVPPAITSLELKNNHTNSPYIEILFEDIPNIDRYEIHRIDSSGNIQDYSVNTNLYTDSTIQYKEKYEYSITSVIGEVRSNPGISKSIDVDIIKPKAIIITTPNHQKIDKNELAISYLTAPDVSYDMYEVMLGKSVDSLSQYTITSEREVFISDLEYNTEYFVSIYSLCYYQEKTGVYDTINFITGLEPIPSPVSLQAISQSNKINLTWDNNNEPYINSFDLERKDEDRNSYVVIMNTKNYSYVDSTILPNVIYSYRVRALSNSGYSGYSNEVSISLVNNPPKAESFAVYDYEDSLISINLLANDYEDDDIEYHIISFPQNGSLSNISETGALDYKPYENWFGNDYFTYQVRDQYSESNIASVTITVLSVNNPPNISDINDVIIKENDNKTNVYFSIYDETPEEITILADSSNKELIPNNNISITKLSNNGYKMEISKLQNSYGSTEIMLSVSDSLSSTTQTFSVYAQAAPHFPPISGNPIDPIWTIYLQTALIDNNNLEINDEIAIFDDEKIVGAFKLTQTLTSENYYKNVLKVWKTLNDGHGYTRGNKYIVKCWDESEQIEYTGEAILSKSNDSYTGDVFPEGDAPYSIASMKFYTYKTQVIPIKEGYQLISLNVHFVNALDVFSEILQCIYFVRDSEGNTLRKIGTQWINNIKDISVTKGFLVKTHCMCQMNLKGIAADPHTPIHLNEGYQIIAYLPDESIIAKDYFKNILDSLDFVRNTDGNMLRKIGNFWVDGITGMNSGEGYLVKMKKEDILTYYNSTKRRSLKHKLINTKKASSRYFPEINGDPTKNIWSIYLKDVTIEGVSIQKGDEVAILDENNIVGSYIIEKDVKTSNWQDQVITVWSSLNNREGYQYDKSFHFRLWDSSRRIELTQYDLTWDILDDSYNEKTFPKDDGRYSIINLSFHNNFGLNDLITLLQEMSGIHSGQNYEFDFNSNPKIGLEEIIGLMQFYYKQ